MKTFHRSSLVLLQVLAALHLAMGQGGGDWWFETDLTNHFLTQAANHPLYMAIANETLPLSNFLGMMQQDDLYVENLFDSIDLVLSRLDPSDDWARFELEYVSGQRGYYRDHFDELYQNYSIAAPKHLDPAVLGYMGFELRAARYDDLGVALVRILPCYTVWALMGEIIQPIADLPNNPNHTYYNFVASNAPTLDGAEGLRRFSALVTYYYNTSSSAVKRRMMADYIQGIQWEYRFADNGLATQLELPEGPVPTFTDLVDGRVNVGLQDDMIHHNLWDKLANGDLRLESFQSLLQQDLLYLRGFYAAFETMERRETDLGKKALLRKDGSARYAWFADQLEKYHSSQAGQPAPYTEAYIDFILTSADRSIHEGLASLYPCYSLWDAAGWDVVDKADLPNNPSHPFEEFISQIDPTNSTSLARMKTLVNLYFDDLGRDWVGKDDMFRAVEDAINFEFLFANGVHQDFHHTK